MSEQPERLWELTAAVARHVVNLFGNPQFQTDLRNLAQAVLEVLPPSQVSATATNATSAAVENAEPPTNPPTQTATSSDSVSLPLESSVEVRAGSPDTPPAPPPARPSESAINQLLNRFNRPTRSDAAETATPAPRESNATLTPYSDSAFLKLLEQRCRMKMEGSRWAAERRRKLARGGNYAGEIDPLDRDIIARARAIDTCFLWMNHPSGPEPSDLSEFDRLANAFEALAEAVTVTRNVVETQTAEDAEYRQSLELLAEAQSILRSQVTRIGYNVDQEQAEVLRWLKETTRREGIYIERYMRLDDRADVFQIDQLLEKLHRLDHSLTLKSAREKARRKLFGKLRYETRQVQDHPEQLSARLPTITRSVDELLEGGIPPSHIELRDLLLPLADHLDELGEVSDSLWSVIREIERYRSRNPAGSETGRLVLSSEVHQLREKLAGKTVLMIGGEQRPLKKSAIEAAFSLAELVWETLDEHTSNEAFLPYLQRDDVVLVLLAIRWSSHSYGDVAEDCRRLGKPLVRLPGGTHPNQIAHQVSLQASDRL